MSLLTAAEARRISGMSSGMLGSPTLASAVKKALTKVEEAAFRGEDTVTVEFLSEHLDAMAAINALVTLGYQAQQVGGHGVSLKITL